MPLAESKPALSRGVCVLVLVATSACLSPHEALGDRALEQGNRAQAIAEYEAALLGDFLVTFEYASRRSARGSSTASGGRSSRR